MSLTYVLSVFGSMPSVWRKILKGQPIQLTDDNKSRSIIFLTSSRQLYWDLEQKIRIDPISKCK